MSTSGDDHGHDHPRNELSAQAKRIYAIRDLLLEKGVISEKDIQNQIEYQEARSPANGAKLVARAWVDPEFKARLIADPSGRWAILARDSVRLRRKSRGVHDPYAAAVGRPRQGCRRRLPLDR